MSDLLPNISIQVHPNLTTDGLLKILRERRQQRAAQSATPTQWIEPYLAAAAVLDVFDPATLVPAGAATPREEAAEALRGVSTPAVGWRDMGYRTLSLTERVTTLRRLGGQPAMRDALALNPDREPTTLQHLFETWLGGSLDAKVLTYRELEELSQLYGWGLEEFGGLPPRADFERLRARRASVALFEHLVGASFTGRKVELQRLRDFVGVVDPSVRSQVFSFLGIGPKAPMVVVGRGGVGKTAVIGRFLLEHVDNPHAGWLPFAYVSFESDNIDPAEPWTVLLPVYEQIAAQANGAGGAGGAPAEAALAQFRSALEGYQASAVTHSARAGSFASQGDRTMSLQSADFVLYSAFIQLLKEVSGIAASAAKASRMPVVLVFDTFERAIYRTNAALSGLWQMLEFVQGSFPDLRVVISGREAPRDLLINGQVPQTLALEDLVESDAVTMLERLGVQRPEVRTALARQIGGNPLNLRLAARAAADEEVGAKGLTGLQTRRLLVARLGPELIRGQLYRRILDHLQTEDPAVRTLAHPGMALRQVTPDIIQKVLAPACGIEAVDEARAQELFEALRREHALVRLEDSGALRYRDEVRGPMLALLKRDQPEQLKALHEHAVDYYAYQVTAPQSEQNLAEQLYHRMMLGQEDYELDAVWRPDVERYLAPAVEELPDAQKIWLAKHMSIYLPPQVYQRAELQDWERLIGRQALELTRYGNPQAVLKLLSERSERTPGSQLYVIEIRALMSLQRFDEAEAVALKAADDLRSGNEGRLAEILWLGAQAARGGGRRDGAVALLADLADFTANLGSRLPQAQALTEWLGLVEADLDGEIHGRLATALRGLTEREIDTERSLMRLACVRLGPAYPDVQRRILRAVAPQLPELIHQGVLDLSGLEPAVDRLRREDDSGARLVASQFDASQKDAAAAAAVASSLLEFVSWTSGGQMFIEALLILMQGEQADLGAATLAGLDEYREAYELSASAPVSA